jgi:hypothetical protein
VQAVIQRVAQGEVVADRDVTFALAEENRKRRDLKRKAQRAERRARLSKRALAKQEARRLAEEAESKKRQERHRVAALSIIDTLGEVHARFMLDVLRSSDDLWSVIDHLGIEISKLDGLPATSTNGCGAHDQYDHGQSSGARAGNGRADHIVPDLSELAADRWTETH